MRDKRDSFSKYFRDRSEAVLKEIRGARRSIFIYTRKDVLHKRLRKERTLSPCTIPFYPVTEVHHIITEIKAQN